MLGAGDHGEPSLISWDLPQELDEHDEVSDSPRTSPAATR
jgi:hypothetical protein